MERKLQIATCKGNGDGLPMVQCHISISVENSTTGYDIKQDDIKEQYGQRIPFSEII